MADRNIKIEIPSAEGWYPFVMTYNADSGFRAFTGDSSIRLSIMYNFPDFDPSKGAAGYMTKIRLITVPFTALTASAVITGLTARRP